MLRDRRLASVLLASCALAAPAAERAPLKSTAKVSTAKGAAPSMDFLEYLGTLESDEGNWTDVMNVEVPDDGKRAQTKPKSVPSDGKSKTEAAANSVGSEK